MLCLLTLATTGCGYLAPRVDVADTRPPTPAAMPQPTAANGSIYQSGLYRPLFEDHRARLVGDTLTVNIVEKVSATAKSTSSVDKSGTISGSVTAFPGISPNAFRRATADGPAATPSPARAPPKTATSSAAPSPWWCAACCPTATC